MIVRMKKIAVIAQAKNLETVAGDLRSLGILHVENVVPPEAGSINSLKEDISLIDQALGILNECYCKSVSEVAGGLLGGGMGVISSRFSDFRFTVKRIIDLWKRYDQLEVYSRNLVHMIQDTQRWGDFDPEEARLLAQKGIYLKLYDLSKEQLKGFPEDVIVRPISSLGKIVSCVVVSRRNFDCSFKEVSLPKQSLESMRWKLAEDSRIILEIKEELRGLFAYTADLYSARKKLEKELEFQLVLSGAGLADEVAYISGYLPADKVNSLMAEAKIKKWALDIRDPGEDDNVPVLLRNPRWVALLGPVYKLMEVAPNYRELDISPLFLIFLALFFGMIIGDAGYGAVYFVLTFFARKKFSAKVKDKNVFFLFYLFSFCAIFWGLLTGTAFGQEWYRLVGFKAYLPILNDTKFIMAFCFLLGAVQLSLAHLWQGIVKFPAWTALADVGFICLLWAGFFLAKMFILGDPFPVFGHKLIWLGIALIVFFVNPRKSFLRTFGAGLGTLALGVMGNFGDVVSYIRLFAVGLAGVAVADAVNTLAGSVPGNIVAQVLILFVGHSINIILGPMSVLVHGIRLNVLEFSVLHGNVTWSGLLYKPFKKDSVERLA